MGGWETYFKSNQNFDIMNDFLVQLIRRFLSETPAFHKVIRSVALVLTVIAALPQFLDAAGLTDLLGDGIMAIVAKVVSVSGIVAAFIAQLAVTEAAKVQSLIEGRQIK